MHTSTATKLETAVTPEAEPPPRSVITLGADEGEQVWFLDNLLTIKVRGDSKSPFSVVENSMPEGSHTPFHRHDGEDEAFYVLEGSLRLYLEGRMVDAGPGSYVHLPKGTPHGFVTLSPVRMLVLCGTDGFAEMVREAGAPAPRPELPPAAAPDLARLGAACDRHSIVILGPLPA